MHARASFLCDVRRLPLSDRPRCRSNLRTASMSSSLLKQDRQLGSASLLLVAGTTLRDLLCPLLHTPGRPAGSRAHRSSGSRGCCCCSSSAPASAAVAKRRIAHLGFRLSFIAPRARGPRRGCAAADEGTARGGVWLADPAVSVEPRHGAVDAGGKGLARCLLRPSLPHPLHAAIPPMLHLITLPRARRCRAAQTHQIACMSGTPG